MSAKAAKIGKSRRVPPARTFREPRPLNGVVRPAETDRVSLAKPVIEFGAGTVLDRRWGRLI